MSQSIITIFIFISHHSLLLYRIQIATSPYTTSTSYNTNEQLSYCDTNEAAAGLYVFYGC
jgi:hypothetical protein